MRIWVVIVWGASLAGCKATSSSEGSKPGGDDPVRAEQAKAFRSGWGTAPATPGPVFGTLAVGGPAGDVSALRASLRDSFSKDFVDDDDARLLGMFRSSRVVISAKAEGGAITELGLWTNDERDQGCPPDLAPAIRAAWKAAPHIADAESDVWLDPARRVRARLSTGMQCRLEYEPYEPAETWIDTVVHLDLVGKPASALAALGVPEAQWKAGSDSVEWSGRGCGFGGGIARITAERADGTIVAVRAGTFARDRQTIDAVVASLAARRGQPEEVPGLSVRRLEWRGDVPLRLDEDNGHIEIEAGRLRP